jgi:hypothetical protein
VALFVFMKTNFYFDAFNLYYGCLKHAPHLKWLNLSAYCQLEFPGDQINRIHYFTAQVKARPADPLQPVRQLTFLRALRTLPSVSVKLGRYLLTRPFMALANPPVGGPSTVQVLKSEEKGSDVNLATTLLVDAFAGNFEQAVVVSNDSDLVYPIQIVQKQFKLPVVVLFPCHGHRKPSNHLSKLVTSAPIVSLAHLQAAQFPNTLTDAHGVFHKPATWV